MCGRFALGRDRDAVLEEAIHAFQQGMNGPRHNRRHRNNNQEEPRDENDHADEEDENWDDDAPIEWVDRDDFHPRYNIAPRTRVPVLRVVVHQSSANQPMGKKRRVLQTMRWGLVPHWSKVDLSSQTANTINARAETLTDVHTGMWSSVKGRRRCLVPCDGYYEWITKGKDKFPHFIRRHESKRPLWLGGLWDCVTLEGETQPLYTFAIVTCPARRDMEWLHDRMPLIFEEGDPKMKQWLDPSNRWSKQVETLLEPFHDSLTIYQVPKEVGKVGAESPAFIQPITERKDGIRAMFAKQQKGSPSPAKPSAPTSEQAQPETQPQSESQSSGKSQVSSEFPTTPVGKRKASVLGDSGVKTPQGSPTKKPRLGSASPRKGGPSPTKQKVGQTASITDFFTRKALS